MLIITKVEKTYTTTDTRAYLRASLIIRLPNGAGSGQAKRDFIRIDHVRLAVFQHEANAFDGVARQLTLLAVLAKTLFNGGDVLGGNDRANDFVFEFQLGGVVGRQRFNIPLHTTIPG